MSQSGLKSASQTGRREILQRIYTYKAISIAISMDDHKKTKTESFAREVKQSFKKVDLPTAMGLIDIFQNMTDEGKHLMQAKLGEMKDLEPLERKLVPQANIGMLLADLTGFYKAFGVESKSMIIDHLAVECEFMAALLLREAYAESSGNKEMYEIVRDAQKKFIKDHLGRAFYFFSGLKREEDPLKQIGTLAESFFTGELDHYGIPGPRPGGFVKDDPMPAGTVKEDAEDTTQCPFA